ncbi:hypothetical protein HF526_32730 [Pseudonocardia sp. K10HN5]|uniref:Uncharacterized protein n=1 Tax=Pseudonocardia acidicola TaxID=2724939 RepID=A0ABX1SKB9_9PSEU|nr:hypothetical protein [Pseudonocardia acidicola]NMI02026.1 hypothetical protein [Pseudonocardia acidicola]
MRSRIVGSARYQEGESPAEDATELLREADETFTELESWIRRINRTNAATHLGADRLARQLRELDVRIQRANCEVELLG